MTRVEREAPQLEGHVLIYRYGPAAESLIDDLIASAAPFVVAEGDEETARLLQERKVPVFLARTEDEGLAAGRLSQARALVANGRDEENAGLILGARQMGYEREIVAFAEEPTHRKPLTLAGASAVYTPRHVLAAAPGGAGRAIGSARGFRASRGSDASRSTKCTWAPTARWREKRFGKPILERARAPPSSDSGWGEDSMRCPAPKRASSR